MPDDLRYAASALVANMLRVMPYGTDVSSENLGAATYSVLQDALDSPRLGSPMLCLKQFRDWSV